MRAGCKAYWINCSGESDQRIMSSRSPLSASTTFFIRQLKWTPKTGQPIKLLCCPRGGINGRQEAEGVYGAVQGAGGVGGVQGGQDGGRVGRPTRGPPDLDPRLEEATAGRRRSDLRRGGQGDL